MEATFHTYFREAELVDLNRHGEGPLEIVFLRQPDQHFHAFGGAIIDWNHGWRSGRFRSQRALDEIAEHVLPPIHRAENPNIVFAAEHHGFSELHAMLLSLLPDMRLRECEVERRSASFWLWPIGQELLSRWQSIDGGITDENLIADRASTHLRRLSQIVDTHFPRLMWGSLVRQPRFRMNDFARDSSLRLIAGDARFWMHRLYQIAATRLEAAGTFESDDYRPLAVIRRETMRQLPKALRHRVQVHRPKEPTLMWDPSSADDRADVLAQAVRGDDVATSLEPVIEVLLRDGCHGDHSERYSWIKEDFERRFHARRSKVRVDVIETVDDLPAWSVDEADGFANVLFRDILSFFNRKDQRLLLAIRQGRTVSDIARSLGHTSHAALSRRLGIVRARVARLLRTS